VQDEDYICDGTDGLDGEDSLIVDIVDPCGDGQGPDEVIMVMADGSFIAWYKNLGFSVLEENKAYVTTDKQKCKFSVSNGEVTEL
jgi:hypothetical protein